ncbi:hypothetical protein [Mesorhizobium sp. Mes31]|uniref:hypothetical protein n=1 Tax=Mesorhizobium sp. Mes31 TaxID=2926017 RepID=UPI0021180F9C|nr:hypothetical protein [Mesorhizobium sp. Mes31]
MSERTSGRSGILESMAIVLALAVACLAAARAEPGPRGCATAAAPVSRDATPANPSPDPEAPDMLLHD